MNMRQLQEVLKREYVNSENRPEVRARFIAICNAGKPPSPQILEAAKRLDDEGF